MIAAEAKLLTYAEAGARLNGMNKKFIQRRVARGEIVVTDLGRNTKRISELDLLKYIEQSRALEKVRAPKRPRWKSNP